MATSSENEMFHHYIMHKKCYMLSTSSSPSRKSTSMHVLSAQIWMKYANMKLVLHDAVYGNGSEFFLSPYLREYIEHTSVYAPPTISHSLHNQMLSAVSSNARTIQRLWPSPCPSETFSDERSIAFPQAILSLCARYTWFSLTLSLSHSLYCEATIIRL